MARKLIVIYGLPLTGKSTLAWSLARSLPDKTAVVGATRLLDAAIAVPDEDPEAELEMMHVQMRLLVANYLKNFYNVVVEGPFRFVRGGRRFDYDAEIDQLVALMRHLAPDALVVRLDAPLEELRRRAAESGREADLPAGLLEGEPYRDRYGVRYHRFDTSAISLDEVRRQLLAAMLAQD